MGPTHHHHWHINHATEMGHFLGILGEQPPSAVSLTSSPGPQGWWNSGSQHGCPACSLPALVMTLCMFASLGGINSHLKCLEKGMFSEFNLGLHSNG